MDDGSCSDANTYGYPDVPRCTFPLTWTIAAGSYIEVHGGVYTLATSSHRWSWTFNGTEANPIWFRGASVASRPEFAENDWEVYGDYVYFENLLFSPWDTTHDFSIGIGDLANASANYMVFRHIEAAGDGIQTVGFGAVMATIGNTDTDKTANIVFYDTVIHDWGDDAAIEENDYHGILPAQYSEDIWILESEIYNLGGDSVQVGSNNYVGEQMPERVYIGNNDFYSNYENAIDVKNAHHVIISSNKLHDFTLHTGYAYANPVVLHQQGGDIPTNLWFIFNEVYDCSQGLRVQDFEKVYIVGNTFANIQNTDGGTNVDSCWYNTIAISMRTTLIHLVM